MASYTCVSRLQSTNQVVLVSLGAIAAVAGYLWWVASQALTDVHAAGFAAVSATSVQSAAILILVCCVPAFGIGLFVRTNVVSNLRKDFIALKTFCAALAAGKVESASVELAASELATAVELLTPIARRSQGDRNTADSQDQTESGRSKADVQMFHALDSISEGFSLYDNEDRLILSNARYRELIYPGLGHLVREGMSFEETARLSMEHGLVARGYQGQTRVDDFDDDEWLAARLDAHRNPSGPFLQRQSDGRWLQINERRMADGSTVAVYEDVSQLMQREQALADAIRDKDAALAERNAVLDAIDYAVLFMDAELNVRIANRAYRALWNIPAGFHPDGTVKNLREYYEQTRPFYDVSDTDWEAFLAPRIESIRRGVTDPAVSYRADGSVLRRSCLALDDGGRMLTYFDITELTRAEEVQREAREQAETATRMKSQFVATMSHELRTPLNAIIGLTEMVIEEAGEEAEEDFLEPMNRIALAGKQLLRLIDDILDLSVIEAGQLTVCNERFDLAALCEEVRVTALPMAEANGNTLTVECEAGLESFDSDPARLRQVLLNLVTNACKFTHDGAVSLSLRKQPQALEFRISDNGLGMDADKLDTYFEAFSQGDSSTSRRYGGAGLGLTISQRICELLGATLEGRSALGEGSVFIVTLPISNHSSSD